MFNIEISTSITTDDLNKIWELLCIADNEFIPSLSARNSSKQKELIKTNDISQSMPTEYFKAIKEQEFIIARDVASKKLIGFMTFIENYSVDYLEDYNPSTYITTIIVDKKYRNKGITHMLYNNMINKSEKNNIRNITTRTWSTNFSHIHILEKIGFNKVNTLYNHRGEGIDTIYFAIRLSCIVKIK